MNRRGAALLAGVWLATGVIAAAPALPASAAPCAFAPQSIAVVVDFGDGSAVSAVCVPADSSDNGADVLAARARQLGTPPPRYASSGLLCAIDGRPADGCGEQNGGSYAYWSYWHGTAPDGWTYQSIGPASWRVRADVVEGWRFEPHGAGNPSDPPPSGSPDPSATCTPPAPPDTPASVEDTAPAAPDAGALTSPTTANSTTSSPTPESPTPESPTTASPTTATSVTTTTARAAAAPVRARAVGPSSGGSSVWPAIGAGVAIAGLGATGLVLARRRRDTP